MPSHKLACVLVHAGLAGPNPSTTATGPAARSTATAAVVAAAKPRLESIPRVVCGRSVGSVRPRGGNVAAIIRGSGLTPIVSSSHCRALAVALTIAVDDGEMPRQLRVNVRARVCVCVCVVCVCLGRQIRTAWQFTCEEISSSHMYS